MKQEFSSESEALTSSMIRWPPRENVHEYLLLAHPYTANSSYSHLCSLIACFSFLRTEIKTTLTLKNLHAYNNM